MANVSLSLLQLMQAFLRDHTGPVLFLLFINDMHLFLNDCYSDFFAEDATIHINSKVLKH